jgi:hypothetical protein
MDLSSGDKVVLRLSSRDAFQWHPSQRLKPEVITFTEAKYVEQSKRGDDALVLKEGFDTAIWVAGRKNNPTEKVIFKSQSMQILFTWRS